MVAINRSARSGKPVAWPTPRVTPDVSCDLCPHLSADDRPRRAGCGRAGRLRGVQFNLSCIGWTRCHRPCPKARPRPSRPRAAARDLRIAALSGTYNMAHPDATVRLAFRPRFANVVAAAPGDGARPW